MDLDSAEEAIFNTARQFADTNKARAYLDTACEGRPGLRGKIERMLAASNEADAFFGRVRAQALELPAEDKDHGTLAELNMEGPGTKIGRYKLLQVIGEGGMGAVYMAEQEEPVRRRVALKLIKLGMDTRQVVARFEAERQALALMDHPNIARVLDGGATETGRPYFVMELVQGVPITVFCDKNKLPASERLKLFVQVCHAIQSAHQKGIIHRDIKPSNVLVTLHHGEPMTKVIDFGIAKATNQKLTEKTLFTHYATMIGTPAYMSPEQAEMSSLDVDTRTDVYALGVLLYELLTGTTPFPENRLRSLAYGEMQRVIMEEEPERPSTRLSTMGNEQKLAVVSNHGDELAELRKLLKGDLDWIVMKCLEKDRTRRYDAANGLAMDVQRHLNNEPVTARPPSTVYRFQKLVHRNKLAFAAAAAVTLTLIAGLGFSTWAFLREAAQRRTADRSAEHARQAGAAADKATSLAEQRAAEINRNLYFAEMNLAGNAAAEAGGISRITDLTTKWLPEKGATDQRGWEWYYLRSLLHQDLFTLSGHTNEVKSVAWSPDGKRLASGSADNTIKIWDVAGRQLALTLIGHTKGVKSVAWSPDGKRLASGSADNTIKIWDAAGRQLALTLVEHTNVVNSVAWSPDGKRLASGSNDRTIKIWDVDSGTSMLTLPGHNNPVFSVAWSPDGQRLASGSFDGTIKVWDVDRDQVIHTLTGHEYWALSVAWSPDGKRLASGGGDYMVRVWDAVAGTPITNLVGHFDVVNSVSWSPDGKQLASGCEDNTIRVWDATSGRSTFTHRGHDKYVLSVAWSPDGRQIASSSEDSTIKIWNATGEETLTLRGHTNPVFSVAWSLDGKLLASASFDNTVKIWDPDGGQESHTLSGHTNKVSSVAWSPDGKFLASGSRDSTIKVWDVISGRTTFTHRGNNQYVSAVAWRPDGKQLASVNEDNTINLYDPKSGQVTLALRGHSYTVHSVAWSPDGKFLASGGWDKTARVWDALGGTTILTLRDEHSDEHSGGYTVVAWSPDGKRLAAGVFDKTVKVWDAVSGRVIHTLPGHSGGVLSVSWSPNGKRLASSSFDGTVKVWDAASGRETLTLRGHTTIVQSVAWSPDGNRLASGSYDNTVKIWDARKGYALERK